MDQETQQTPEKLDPAITARLDSIDGAIDHLDEMLHAQGATLSAIYEFITRHEPALTKALKLLERGSRLREGFGRGAAARAASRQHPES